ncbi:MAG: hypothetical protein E7422_04645 [Ruminococcaceae bacterium]|nr:hypothetical protein [Oscillospiraceae bacterium]
MRTALKTLQRRVDGIARRRAETVSPQRRAEVEAFVAELDRRYNSPEEREKRRAWYEAVMAGVMPLPPNPDAPPPPKRWISKGQHDRLTAREQVENFLDDETGVDWNRTEKTMTDEAFSGYVAELRRKIEGGA